MPVLPEAGGGDSGWDAGRRPGGEITGTPLPEKVGSYVITGLLGEGGQGIVYAAEQQSPQRTVALKVLKGGRFVSQQDVRHFERESQALAALNHPNIATIYEAGRTEEGQHFFAMELVAGVPLDAYARDRDLPPEERLKLFGKVCDAVQHAHGQGVIHRDLKPTNILVVEEGTKAPRHGGTQGRAGVPPASRNSVPPASRNSVPPAGGVGQPKILDFGLARITEADVTLTVAATETGGVMGTLRYMSPEQARGQGGQVDARSDVYALGVILYELLTDRPPYEIGRFMPGAVRTICDQPPQKPSSLSRTLRGDLETIVLKALEKESSRRYQSVAELAADVRRYLAGEPILAKPPSGLYVLRKKLGKHRLRIALAAVAVALGMIGLWSGTHWRDRSLQRQRGHELTEGRLRLLTVQHDLERGPVEAAVGRAQALFEQYQELPEACLVLAQACFRAPEGESRGDAIDKLEWALQRRPSQPTYAALLAEMYRLTGNAARAAELKDRAERHLPDTAEEWYLWSLATLDEQQALECAEEAVKRDHEHALAWRRLARLSLLKDDLDGALRAAEMLSLIEGDRARWNVFRGQILARKGRFHEAIEQYGVAIGDNEWAGNAYRSRAHIYRRLGEYPRAVNDYTKALEFFQNRPDQRAAWVWYQRATPLWILGRTQEAVEDLYAACKRLARPSYADARIYLILRGEGRDSEAAAALNRALVDVSNPWLTKIFECLADQLSPEDLLAYGLASENREHHCEAYYYAGEVWRLSGDWQKAEESFELCVQTGVAHDLDCAQEPMNEYELAYWRLGQLDAQSTTTSQSAGG